MSKERSSSRTLRRNLALTDAFCALCLAGVCLIHALGQINQQVLTAEQVLQNAQQLQGSDITFTGYGDWRGGEHRSKYLELPLPVTVNREIRHETGGCILPSRDSTFSLGGSIPSNCIYWIGELDQLRLETHGVEATIGNSIGDGKEPVVVRGDFERNPAYFPGSGLPEWVLYLKSVR